MSSTGEAIRSSAKGRSKDERHLSSPCVVCYGGGINSTAMLIGMIHKGMAVDLILFSDTGGEKPSTYEFLDIFDDWLLKSELHLGVTRVSYDGMDKTLEQNCLRRAKLPSLAYGSRHCSSQYKRGPQEKYCNHWAPANSCWKAGGRVTKAIGFSADERRRMSNFGPGKYRLTYPLIDWGWGQKECEEAIKAEGLPIPPRSSCFFCPATRKKDVLALAHCYPDLFERAVAIEKRFLEDGRWGATKGLGRHWSWSDLVKADAAQQTFFEDPPKCPCMCLDEDEDESHE